MLAGIERIADPLVVAGLNATVLSVFFAVVLAYTAGTPGKLDELESRAIDKAEEINDVPLPGSYGGPKDKSEDTSGAETRRRVVNVFADLATYSVRPSDPSPAERGEETLRIITILTHFYPFPPRFELLPDGSMTSRDERLVFRSTDEVRTWIRDVQAMSRKMLWAVSGGKTPLQRTLGAADEEWRKRFDMSERLDRIADVSPDAAKSIREANERAIQTGPVWMFNAFVQAIDGALRIASEAESELHKIDAFWRRRPARPIVLGSVAIAIAVFVSGVIVPLVDPGASKLFVVWIPIGFYLAVAFAIIAFVYREYRPPEKPKGAEKAPGA